MADASKAGESLSKITECFLGFGVDPKENIARLTQFCGELLGAQSAMYDRMDGMKMSRLVSWNLPQDGAPIGFGQGNMGYDKIKMGQGDIFEIEHLYGTNNDLHTYFGRVVKDRGIPFGALCVLFRGRHTLSEGDREVLGILGSALAVEDKRLRAESIISDQQMKMVGTAKLSALGELAGGVAHEINNPLLAILMRVEQLRDMISTQKLDLVEMKRITDLLESLTMRISRIVKSLQQFAGDTQDEPFQEVTLQEVVEGSIEFCGERFKQNHVELKMGKYEPSLKFECRPTELSRVLLNLLSNAYDAVEESPKKWISLEFKDLGEKLEIAVCDSGNGIPEGIRSRIFDPFFSTKDVNRGKGLGLSISKGIIDKHQGTLQLDVNSPNTRFVLVLPKSQKPTQKLKL